MITLKGMARERFSNVFFIVEKSPEYHIYSFSTRSRILGAVKTKGLSNGDVEQSHLLSVDEIRVIPHASEARCGYTSFCISYHDIAKLAKDTIPACISLYIEDKEEWHDCHSKNVSSIILNLTTNLSYNEKVLHVRSSYPQS